MLVMMMVVGVDVVDAAVVVVEVEGAVVVVVVSEPKLNFDEERKSTMSHDLSCDIVDFLSPSKFNFGSLRVPPPL